jgi:hypothetical protein
MRQREQRFAALNKIVTDLFERGLDMHASLLLPHSSRILSRRTPRSSEHHARKSAGAQRSVARDVA